MTITPTTTATLTYTTLRNLIETHGRRTSGYLTIGLPELVNLLGQGSESAIVSALQSDENLDATRRIKPWPADVASAKTRRSVRLGTTWYTVLELMS